MGRDGVTFRDEVNLRVGFMAGTVATWASISAPKPLKLSLLVVALVVVCIGIAGYLINSEMFRDDKFISRSMFGFRRSAWEIESIDHFDLDDRGRLWLVSRGGTAALLHHGGRYDSAANLNSVLATMRASWDGPRAIAI